MYYKNYKKEKKMKMIILKHRLIYMKNILKRIERTHKNGMTCHPLEWTSSRVYVSAVCSWCRRGEKLIGDTAEKTKQKDKKSLEGKSKAKQRIG